MVAVEPQPDLVRFLRWLFRNRPEITLRAEAIAAAPGRVRLLVSPRTPTVSTGSPRFIADAARVLVPGGELVLVYNSHLPYLPRLREVGPTEILAQDRSYLVTRTVRA